MRKSKIYLTLFFFFSIILFSFTNVNAGCVTNCTYTDNGVTCAVSFEQHFGGSGNWAIGIACTDGYMGSDSGSGIYTGSICGGTDPLMC